MATKLENSPSQSNAQFLRANYVWIGYGIAVVVRLNLIANHIIGIVAERSLSLARVRQ